jgi:hypothetical protein
VRDVLIARTKIDPVSSLPQEAEHRKAVVFAVLLGAALLAAIATALSDCESAEPSTGGALHTTAVQRT